MYKAESVFQSRVFRLDIRVQHVLMFNHDQIYHHVHKHKIVNTTERRGNKVIYLKQHEKA